MQKAFFQNLNDAFNNYDKIFECCCKDAFYPGIVDRYLSTLLKYYIVTRNTPSHLTYEQMKEFNEEIKNRVPTANEIDNILKNGYLSHSFYDGQNFIFQHGFDYQDKVSIEDINKRDKVYESLKRLEENGGKSSFIRNRELITPESMNQEKFFIIIGNKTVYYASFAPERLYTGPIDKRDFYQLPIVVGESKKNYLLRALEYSLDDHCCDDEIKEVILKEADCVMDYYSQYPTCIAFISMQDALSIEFDTNHFRHRTEELTMYYNNMIDAKYSIHNMLSNEESDEPEIYDVGDLVTLEKNLKEIVPNIIKFTDWYDIRQEYLKRMNFPEGTLVTFENCIQIDFTDNEFIKKYYKSL